ncbi:MAG: ABC transporter ATP-binding protein [Clostridia bacterium]|nr:ABC transporter ATP-binding protein [Clostridia bacterium]
MIEIVDFSKFYGEKKAVDGLDLKIENGDIYGFIGHNGAGKTTTIKAITGIHKIEHGDILIDGVSIKTHPTECKRTMAYIPDSPDLYEYLTARRFINFICDVYGIGANERKERIEKYSALFGMTANLDDKIGTYSHGMKQKAAIIAALCHDPKNIVMDEPFVGLDPKAAHTVKELMREICAQGGCIFFSTHVLEVAEKLCNKIAIIKEGKLIESGPIDEVRGNSSLEDIFLELTDDASNGESL